MLLEVYECYERCLNIFLLPFETIDYTRNNGEQSLDSEIPEYISCLSDCKFYPKIPMFLQYVVVYSIVV